MIIYKIIYLVARHYTANMPIYYSLYSS